MRNPLLELWSATSGVMAEVEQWLSAHDKKKIRLNYKLADQVRLLKLRVWCIRYDTDIPEILDLVVRVLRAQIPTKFKSSWGIGVPIRSLTGKAAERLLKDELERLYPGGENVFARRNALKQQQLHDERMLDLEGALPKRERLIKILDANSAQEFVEHYRERVTRIKERTQKEERQSWRKRKPYRGNPWIN